LFDEEQQQETREQTHADMSSDTENVGSPAQSCAASPLPLSPHSPGSENVADDRWHPDVEPTVEQLKLSVDFIRALQNASLDGSGLSDDALHRIRNTPRHALDIDDPTELLSLRHFLGASNTSQHTYANVQKVHNDTFPEQPMLSYEQARKKLEEWTGVESIVNDMCPNSCISYSGPFSSLDICPECHSSRYDTQILGSSRGKTRQALQQYYTMPLGPQIQAIWRSRTGAEKMTHRQTRTKEILDMLEKNSSIIEEYDDLYHGSDYLNACLRGDVHPQDTLIMHAMDGAQLYKDKDSDCWVLLWILVELSPDFRYKKTHALPAAVIAGVPKFMESFLFPGFYHVAALQREGLLIWNALEDKVFTSFPYYLLGA
jgi:hypothetical protein